MHRIPPKTENTSERGVTFIELAIASLLLAITVIGLMKVFMLSDSGGVSMRAEVRATALAKSKLDDIKELARRYSMAGVFDLVTQAAEVQADAVTQTVLISGQPFTWKVSAVYALQNLTHVADVTYTAATSLIHLRSWVAWQDKGQAQAMTLEALVADQMQ